MKKRLLAIFMMVAMIITMVPIVVLAEDEIVKSFEITSNLTFLFDEYADYDLNYKKLYCNLELTDGTYYENAPIERGMIQDDITYNGGMIAVEFYDQLSEEEPWAWTEPGDYKVTVKLPTLDMDYETEITVHLVDKIVTEAKFADSSVYEYTNGYYTEDGTYIYNPVIEIESAKVNGEDYSDVPAWDIFYEEEPYRAELCWDQYETPLRAGDKVTSASILGYTGDINFEVLKADIIDKMTVVPQKITITEYTNGYYDYDAERYIYDVAPQFSVKYADGSVGFNPVDASDGEGLYYENAIGEDFNYSWHNETWYEQYDEAWTAGNTYSAEFNFIGKSIAYEIEIVPSDVESIEILESPKVIPNEYGDYFVNQDQVAVEVTYTDGTTKQTTCEELGSACRVDLNYVDDTLTVTYQGKSDTVDVIVADADSYPIESLEIVENTLGSAYLIDGTYYFSPADFDVIVHYKDTTTSTEHIARTGEPVWIKKDGYTMNLSSGWIDYDTWTDDSHPFSVNVDDGFVESDKVEVDVIKDVTCEGVELITPQTYTYYKNDTLFSDCGSDTFFPFDFRGMEAKVIMSDGTTFDIYGDNLYFNSYGVDEFKNYGSSNGVDFALVDEADGYTSHISIEVFGQTFSLYDIEAVDSNISNIEISNYDDMKDKLAQNDATGLEFKVSYADGKTKEIKLGAEETGWFSISWDYKGDVELTPVDETGTSGIRYSWYKVDGEYASIIWNNMLLRFEDTIIFLDTGKVMKVNSDVDEVTVSSASINNNIIDQLTLEERYKVEQQGMDINTEMTIESTEASENILKLAAKDDVTIDAAYSIDINYVLDGETTQVTELGDGKILITVKLPDEMLGKDKYVVYREHKNADGSVVVEEIEATLSDDGKYISFESSKFSTFALGYAEDDETPGGGDNTTPATKPANGGSKDAEDVDETIAKTLDNSPIGGTIALMMSSGLCAFAVVRKKKEL